MFVKKLIVFEERKMPWVGLAPRSIQMSLNCFSNYFCNHKPSSERRGAGPGVLIPPWAGPVLPQGSANEFWEMFIGKALPRTEIITGTRGVRSRRSRKLMENKVLKLLDAPFEVLVPCPWQLLKREARAG